MNRPDAARPTAPSGTTISRDAFFRQLQERAERERVPVTATLEVTYGCNLRCVHCFNPTHEARGELGLDELRRIVDGLVAAGCFQLTLTGGEVLTRRDWPLLASHARSRGLSLVLLTNATLVTDAAADRIRELEFHSIEVSIYGATADTYDAVTGVSGGFAKFIAGLARLRSRGLPLVVKMPVMTLNRHEARQARRMIEGLGIRFVYSTEIHRRVDRSPEPLTYRLSPSEVLRVDLEMRGHLAFGSQVATEAGCGATEVTTGTERSEPADRPEAFTCRCGKNKLAITPYGKMNFCVSFPTPQYDVMAGGVAEGWRTLVDLARGTAPSETRPCPTCDLESVCRQGSVDSWLETGHLDACIPHFKELAALERRLERRRTQS